MRVLIVEDEHRMAEAIADGLTLEGFSCDVVHDGLDGLWRASEDNYAAIVLDLLLPGMNGYRVCEELRRRENWTPVLVLTAKDGDFDLVDSLDCGADDFLSKPFSFAVLTARLRALIRRGHVPRVDVLVVGDIHVDPFSGACRINDTPTQLTGREAGVLTTLMRQPGRFCTRDHILSSVWGLDFDGNPQIVDVYLSHLRKKLADAGSRASIVNRRGRGFALRADG